MVPLHSNPHLAHETAPRGRGLGDQFPNRHRSLFNPHHLRTVGRIHPHHSLVARSTLAFCCTRAHSHREATSRTHRDPQRFPLPCGSCLGNLVPPPRGRTTPVRTSPGLLGAFGLRLLPEFCRHHYLGRRRFFPIPHDHHRDSRPWLGLDFSDSAPLEVGSRGCDGFCGDYESAPRPVVDDSSDVRASGSVFWCAWGVLASRSSCEASEA